MNRADRRRLKRMAKHPERLAHAIASNLPRGAASTAETVKLVGGPMDGWLVKPDAPALQAGWWPEHLADLAREAFEQTRKVGLARGVPEHELPAWDGITDAKRAEYVQMARAQKGDGRYALTAGSREARWEPAG
jgi:hypothetical protein